MGPDWRSNSRPLNIAIEQISRHEQKLLDLPAIIRKQFRMLLPIRELSTHNNQARLTGFYFSINIRCLQISHHFLRQTLGCNKPSNWLLPELVSKVAGIDSRARANASTPTFPFCLKLFLQILSVRGLPWCGHNLLLQSLVRIQEC